MLLELEEWFPEEVRWPPGLEEPMTCVVAMLGISVGDASGEMEQVVLRAGSGTEARAVWGELGGGFREGGGSR